MAAEALATLDSLGVPTIMLDEAELLQGEPGQRLLPATSQLRTSNFRPPPTWANESATSTARRTPFTVWPGSVGRAKSPAGSQL